MIGHTRTCPQPESGGQSIMHSLQPCQLGNDSLLNMVPIPPLGNAWRGRPLVNHSEFQEDLGWMADVICCGCMPGDIS